MISFRLYASGSQTHFCNNGTDLVIKVHCKHVFLTMITDAYNCLIHRLECLLQWCIGKGARRVIEDALAMVETTINHVRISNRVSLTCSFLSVLFSVPIWSSRIRSIAAIRSSRVSVWACTGESGSQIRTQIPTTIARPPRRMNKILYGGKLVLESNEIPCDGVRGQESGCDGS